MITPTLPGITGDDETPAQHLLVELKTRITTQRLHYRSGDEETAAKSVRDLFPTTRKLLADHPKARAFGTAALFLLNGVVRSYTARWHRWIVDERFAGERARRQFRVELRELQPRLLQFAGLLELLVGGPANQAKAEQAFTEIVTGPPPPPAATTPDQVADLGGEIKARIDPAVIPLPQLSRPLPPPLPDGLGRFAAASDINRAERKFIHRRRRALGLPAPQNPAEDQHAPVVDATGLCLSGGGIRSATFCLGIVQVLARQGMLPQLDYLSTVSGGGYLGAFLTAYLGTPEAEARAAFSAEEIHQATDDAFNPVGGHESAAMRHLRNNSRYLLKAGLWGRLMALGLVVSGIVTNLFLVLPLPLLAVLAVFGLSALGFWGAAWPASLAGSREWPAFLVFGASTALLVLAWFFLPVVQNGTRGAPPKSGRSKLRTFWEWLTLILALLTLGAAILLLLPAVFQAVAAVSAWRPSIAGMDIGKLVATLGTVAPIVFGALAGLLKAGRGKKVATALFTLSGPLFCGLLFLFVGRRVLGDTWAWTSVAWIAGVLTVWAWLFIDVNILSPHGYYRNRLCECYLAVRRRKDDAGLVRGLVQKVIHGRRATKIAAETGVGTVRQLPLSEMNATGAAPYHLINAAVNLPASIEPNLRGRDCDFYLFSRHYCGGPVCGYVKTEAIEKLDPHVDLGTAMAVSGAAASANMGVKTLKQLRFLMALLNVRLGYWLRNPRSGLRHALNAPGPRYLFYEMAGRMHERRPYLNLSDGGHIENLALYELLRRRCKLIVVVDGGMEPGMECADLMLAQRYAEIDLGVRFELDIADLALDAGRQSRAYAIFGKIQYSDDELGWLLYLKLAMTGAEPGYVVDYRRQNPDFPHQTTGDQIYDEAQFEAYRRLGESAAESLFRDELTAGGDIATLRGWFQCLANNLLPDNDEAFKKAPASA
jgi:patatin-like phospholipase